MQPNNQIVIPHELSFYYKTNYNILNMPFFGMPQIGGNKHNFIKSDKVKTKFIHDWE